jgi:serine/threonine protein kinase
VAGRRVQDGRYVFEELIGQGGMSTVYRARDTHFSNRVVAVKEMVDQFADAAERAEAEANFAHEADLLAGLRHPSIPQVIDRFSENSRHFLVMEFIGGKSLEDMMEARRGVPFAEDQVRHWALELCSVLAYLHDRMPPIIFRDLKLSNVMIEDDGQLRLIDFGIARLFKPQKTADTTALGTTGYASPEHYTGQTDARSDIYSLGAMLHYLLSGRDPSKFPPFQFPRLDTLNPAVSPAMVALTHRCLEPDRASRFGSVGEVRAVLEGGEVLVQPWPAGPAPAASTPPSGAATGATRGAPSGNLLVLADVRSGADRGEIVRRVASISGSPERATGALLKHLPAVIPVTQPALLPAEVQQLTRLGVDARTAAPVTDLVDIQDDLRQELHNSHQLVIWDATVGNSRTCRCHRCGHIWRTKKQVGEKVPRFCPQCGSPEWSKRRLFKCAWCSHEFETADLARLPEVIYPTCPSCGLSDWLRGPGRGSRGLLAGTGTGGSVIQRVGELPVVVRVAAPFAVGETAYLLTHSAAAATPGPALLILFLSFVFFGRPPRRSRRRRGPP